MTRKAQIHTTAENRRILVRFSSAGGFKPYAFQHLLSLKTAMEL